MRWSWLRLPIVAAILALVAGCTSGAADDTGRMAEGMQGVATGGMSTGGVFHGVPLAASYPMPDITLTDTAGRPFNLVTDTTDPVTLMFFGYTNCPDVCPLVMSDLAVAMTRLAPDVRAETQVVFVTTDPARDTPPVIRAFLDRYNRSFIGLTGSMADIRAVADDLQVAIDGRKQLPDGGYDIGHGAQIIGFQHDMAPVVWMQGTPISALAADITTLAAP